MSQYVFSRSPQVDVPRSVFRRNHSLKTTLGTDYLYPIYVDEALPGDTFEFKQEIFGRLTTPLTPLMDDLYLDTFYFAVPIRLVDDNFKKFMGENRTGGRPENISAPMIKAPSQGFGFNTLYDYLGIPPSVGNIEINAWFPRAYMLVFNEWFRDENMQGWWTIYGINGANPSSETYTSYALAKRFKRLDYLTGCLPWPQKGDTVTLPIGDTANVWGRGPLRVTYKNTNDDLIVRSLANVQNPATGTPSDFGVGVGFSSSLNFDSTSGQYFPTNSSTIGVVHKNQDGSNLSGLYADLSSATSITINQLRESIAVQHWFEALARGGSRYIELIRTMFGVTSPDARMQRPEYLGGSSERMNVTTVAQTSESTSTSPLGNLASFVTCTSNAYWKKSFTEHTIIIGLANIRANLSYSQGIPRMFSRKTRLDFYFPQFANLGEQAVLNKEIYAQGTDADDDVFGYQERWAEYRYHPNYITGNMRPSHPQSLDVWHLSQEFESLPTLNSEFMRESVPIARVVAVPSEPPFMLWGDFNLKCARPMPLYSIPGLNRL